MKVYEAIANAFIKEGTTTIFGLLGDGNMLWSAAMSKYPGVQNVDVRDEGAALTMAEGWARATGKASANVFSSEPAFQLLTTATPRISISRTSSSARTSSSPAGAMAGHR